MAQPDHSDGDGRLTRPKPALEREALRYWRMIDSGMAGPRGPLPGQPDDLVAYRLLDAAGMALERGDGQRGVNILRLLIRDYRQSREAAVARAAIDQLAARQR